MKIAIFMFALPAAGKTTWIQENNKVNQFLVVSADEIKENHHQFDPKDPEALQQYSVERAEEEAKKLIYNDVSFIMDAGGINNKYTLRIINEAKKADFLIRLVHIDTPLIECLKRNKYRQVKGERSVPREVILSKDKRLHDSLFRLKNIVDEYIRVRYYKDTHIFVDMDGVVASYQTLPRDKYGNIDFINHNVFLNAKPVTPVIDKLHKLTDDKYIYILSASANSICNEEKMEWLKKHMPWLIKENIFFVGNKDYKIVMLLNLMEKYYLTTKDVMLIEDNHNIIRKGILEGINVIHVSNFLAEWK